MNEYDEATRGITDAADADLVLRTRSGDSDAFGELWRRHYRSGLTVARSITSTFDADDLVQEAYARIYQAIVKGGGPTGSFRAYLFTSIRNTAAGWGRGNRESTIDELEAIEDPETSEQATEEALDRSLTHQAFRSLPSRWQEVLWYTEIEQMKPAEIAPLLGMKPTAVAQLSFRAREGLREAWIQAHLRSVEDGSECQWTIEHMGAYARENLSKRDLRRFESHVADCARCAIVAAEAKVVSHRLAMILLPLSIGAGAATSYLATTQGAGAPIVALAAGAGADGTLVAGAPLAGSVAGSGGAAAAGGGSAGGGSAGAGSSGGGIFSSAGTLIALVAAGALVVAGAVTAAVVLPQLGSSQSPLDNTSSSAEDNASLDVGAVESETEADATTDDADAPADTTPPPTAPGPDPAPTSPVVEDSAPSGGGAEAAPSAPAPPVVVAPPAEETEPNDGGEGTDPGEETDPGGGENPTDPGDGGENPTDPGDGGENPTDPGDGGENPTDPGDGGENPTEPETGLPDGSPEFVDGTISLSTGEVALNVQGAPNTTVRATIDNEVRAEEVTDDAGAATLRFTVTADEVTSATAEIAYVSGDEVGPATDVNFTDADQFDVTP